MEPLAKSRIQMFGAWCAISYLVALFISWGAIAGFLPPMAPSADAARIDAFYQGDYTRIRVAMLVVMLAALIFVPFAAVTSQFIARIEGTAGVLTYTFLLGAAGNMVLTFCPAIWSLVVRQEHSTGVSALVRLCKWLDGVDDHSRSAAVLLPQGPVRLERHLRRLGPSRRVQRLFHRHFIVLRQAVHRERGSIKAAPTAEAVAAHIA